MATLTSVITSFYISTIINSQCFQSAIKANIQSTDLLMNIGHEFYRLDLDHSKIVYDPGKNNDVQHYGYIFQRIDVYYGFLSEQTAPKIFEKLAKTQSWNSRAKFIIHYEGNITSLFIIASQYYVYNLAVLMQDTFYTYFPYIYENANAPNLEASLLGKCNITNLELFPNKIPRYWRNTTLRSMAIAMLPYIICLECKTGIDMELLERFILPKLKFNVTYTSTKEYWGALKNGSWVGGVSYIISNSMDFVFGYFHTRDYQAWFDFDLSYPYSEDNLIWIVPRAELIPHWMNLLHCYTPKTWFLITASVLITALFWTILGHYSHFEEEHYRTTWNTSMIPFKMIVSELSSIAPKTFHIRVLFLSTWVFIYMIQTSWEAHLTYYLTHEIYGYQIKTVKEIVSSGLRIALSPASSELYHGEGTVEGDYVYRHNDNNYFNVYQEGDRVAYTRDTAAASTTVILRYGIIAMYDGGDYFYPLPDIIIKDMILIPFRKGHPCFGQVNELILHIRSGGFVEHIKQSVFHTLELQTTLKTPEKFKSKVINLEQMKAIFILSLIGYFFAFIFFLIEIFYFKYMKKKTAPTCQT